MNALISFAKADAGELSRQRFLRANGPALCQPRATPWVRRREQLSPEGAAQAPRPDLVRPYRTQSERNPKPRALPWADIVRTVGAEEAERSDFLIRSSGKEFWRKLGKERAATFNRGLMHLPRMVIVTAGK